MPERFLIADMHLGHKAMVMMPRDDGTALRPWGRPCPERDMPEDEVAERVAAMNEAIVDNWNRVVGPRDKVEVLGDVAINRKALSILARLNGRKRLSGKGNHDIFALKDYLGHFEDVAAYKIIDDMIMSHMPIHEAILTERWETNVHGHLHDREMLMNDKGVASSEQSERLVPHPRYMCVSVEHIDYTPISLDDVRRRIRMRREGLLAA